MMVCSAEFNEDDNDKSNNNLYYNQRHCPQNRPSSAIWYLRLAGKDKVLMTHLLQGIM
jgi:hypothetical protein